MTSEEPSQPQIQLSKAKPVLIGTFVFLVIAVLILSRSSGTGPRPVQGVLTHIDVSKRFAAAELMDPRTNSSREVLGEVAADCLITINGAPAELSDLRVGDKVTVTAALLGDKRPSGAQALASAIEVTR